MPPVHARRRTCHAHRRRHAVASPATIAAIACHRLYAHAIRLTPYAAAARLPSLLFMSRAEKEMLIVVDIEC